MPQRHEEQGGYRFGGAIRFCTQKAASHVLETIVKDPLNVVRICRIDAAYFREGQVVDYVAVELCRQAAIQLQLILKLAHNALPEPTKKRQVEDARPLVDQVRKVTLKLEEPLEQHLSECVKGHHFPLEACVL